MPTSDNTQTLRLNHALTFYAPTGEELPLFVHTLKLDRQPDGDYESLLRFDVDVATYGQIENNQWFSLYSSFIVGEKPDFTPGHPLEIVAALQPDVLAALLQASTEANPETAPQIETLAQAFADPAPTNPLRSTASWLIHKVVQQIPSDPAIDDDSVLKVGFQTRWALQRSTPGAPKTPSQVPTDIVVAFLIAENWPYEQLSPTLFRIAVEGSNGKWLLLIDADHERQLCLCYSIYPDDIPEAARPAVAAFLINENYDLPVGSFEMDLEDGDLRFRTSVAYGDSPFTLELLTQLVTLNIAGMDFYLHDIQYVVETNS